MKRRKKRGRKARDEMGKKREGQGRKPPPIHISAYATVSVYSKTSA